MKRSTVPVLGLPALACTFELVVDPKMTQNSINTGASLPVELSALMDSKAFGMMPGEADFDGNGYGYPAQFVPAANFTYGGTNYIFPQYAPGTYGKDNVKAQGQLLDIPRGRYIGVHMLAASDTGMARGSFNASYADGSSSSSAVLVDPFWDWPYPYGGSLVFPYLLTNESVNYNQSMIFQSTAWLDASKELIGLSLPNVTAGSGTGVGGGKQKATLHVFAVSIILAKGSNTALDVQFARSTNTWIEGTNKTQIYEAIINNVGTEWILLDHDVKVTVESEGVKTVQTGRIKRLRPGDQARVQIGVINTELIAEGITGPATIVISGRGIHTNYTFNATYGIAHYEPTLESIYRHESPPWYNNGKYGIFIHWGVYSVPGWGNVAPNEAYAEWYWWYLNQGPNTSVDTYDYHLKTYGLDVVYDDFIANFTASAFDPKEWVDLFADAGATYFVQVSKHHDGYALFDLPANVTKRTSVAQFPHRNLLQELFDAADQHQPHLHKATYFSLPEWFSPGYAGLGFGDWPGGNATNPFTNETLPYTGYVPVSDYVVDVILPEMRTLAAMGTEIMWCDIGGPNLTALFAAEYFNAMAAQGKQVLTNNRCGTPGDFDTPEYARYDAVQTRKWESNLGLDPFSYGYNRATPEEAYLTPQGIVTSLVDIISKNGNFLLDVGPTADGTIIEVEQRSLRDAGRWIRGHAEAVFNTTYWYVTPEEGQAVRFTQTHDAFYITTLYAPNGTFVLDSPVPYLEGDAVTVVGGNMSGTAVPSRLLGNGSLELMISEEIRDADQYAWVFKICY